MGVRVIERKFKSALARLSKGPLAAAPLEHYSLDSVRSILVVRQHNELGDMLCCVPLLRALKQYRPDSSITLVASPVNFDIMRNNPFLDEVVLFDKRHPLRFVRRLRSRQYDLSVVPCTVSMSFTSDGIALASAAKLRVGARSLNGVENPSAHFHNILVPLNWIDDGHLHHAARNLDILKPLGVSTGDLSTVVGLTAEERQWASEFLNEQCGESYPRVGYHSGAGKRSNRWPASRFAQLANLLAEKMGAQTILTSGPKDDKPTEEVLSILKHKSVVVRNRTIREVAAVIDQLDLFVTNDTGVMHVAGGTSTPVLSLFGPTDPLQWAPIGRKNRSILSGNGMMASIAVERVAAEAVEMLQNC